MRDHQPAPTRASSGLCRSVSVLALFAAVTGLAPQLAHAQARTGVATAAAAAPNDIEELVVTARKRAERLRDIPIAVTALSSDDIRDMGGIPSAQSLLTNVPGVNFANTSNPITSDVSLRGSGTSRATNAEAGVGLFRDGAFIGGGTVGGRTFTDLDLFDPGRIEVLRGVQGGLNGRNAEGGSINVISARPSHNFEGYATATLGIHDLREIQAVTNVPLGEHWAARFGVDFMDQKKGFYHLPVIGQYADAQFKNFYRAQLNYQNGRFTANMLYEHGAERLPGLIYYVVTFPGATYPKGIFTDKYETAWNAPSKAKQDIGNFEFTANYDFGGAQLDTVTMFRDRHGENAYDRDASSIDFARAAVAAGKVAPTAVNAVLAADYAQGGDQLDHARIVYQDAHFSGSGLGALSSLKWVAGGEYYLLHDTPGNVLAKSPTTASPSTGTFDKGRLRFESWAVYGSAAYDITERLNLSADMRYTHDDEVFSTRRYDFGTGVLGAAAFNIDATRKAGNTSYTVTVAYKPITDWLVYGKVGTGYRAGGFNSSLGDPRQPTRVPAEFDNETVTAYEAGFKGNITREIYVTATGYENHFKSIVIQGDNGCALGNPVCPVQATSFAFNAGPATLYGLEVEAVGRFNILGGPLKVTLGAAHQGGKVTGGLYKGRHQPQQPKNTQTFNLNYRHDLISGVTGFINLQGSSRQGGVQEVAQTPPLHDYTLVNGRVGVNWQRYEVSLYANNLTNENYVVFEAISATNNVRRSNFPLTWGAQLRYRW
ncbi:TonB-dependent receptor [Phenylobacterium sp.]|uniref:TonB-dependent receptor n=1 Tax=Phenylobacterium sp. TaxID=1871053 RepID=UPI00374D978C